MDTFLSPEAAHLANLYCKAYQFFTQGLAPAAIKIYSAGKKKFNSAQHLKLPLCHHQKPN